MMYIGCYAGHILIIYVLSQVIGVNQDEQASTSRTSNALVIQPPAGASENNTGTPACKPVSVGDGHTSRKRTQDTLSTFVVRPTSITCQKRLNGLLLKMIVKDMQPFSIVEDEGFREFLAALDPSFSLPSRTTLTKELLPDMYNTTVIRLKEALKTAEAIALTTDGWTSMTTESYIAVTAHYITSDFKMNSCLLECFKYGERHTAENLSTELQRCINEWGLEGRIQAVVTDSAANVTAAVRLTGLTHIFCFAHMLNLIVQNGIKAIKPMQNKVKNIVQYFHRSTVAAEKLKALQQQMRPGSTFVKLKMTSSQDGIQRMICLVVYVKYASQ